MNHYASYPDEALLQLLQSGDREAFDAIYRRYWLGLLDAAYYRLQNRQQAEDLVQDVFFGLWSKREKLAVHNLGAYLRTAVHYQVINFVTRHKEAHHFYAPFEALLMESDTPEGQLIAKELWELIYAYADTLPGKRKAVFLLHIQSKLSTAEIAGELQVSRKTVQNHLGTALQGLKTQLAPVLAAILLTRL